MKSAKARNAVSLIFNLLTVILVVISIRWFFFADSGAGNMTTGGTRCFRYFTNDSNILAAIIAAVIVPFNIKAVISGKDSIPDWALTLKMVGTAEVTLTMMVVVLFLGPTSGYGRMFAGVCLYLHLICPLLAIISFCFLERGLYFTKKRTLWMLIPVLIYAAVYLVNVIIIKVWPDFYGFNMGGMWYVSLVAVPGASYLFALILRILHNKFE